VLGDGGGTGGLIGSGDGILSLLRDIVNVDVTPSATSERLGAGTGGRSQNALTTFLTTVGNGIGASAITDVDSDGAVTDISIEFLSNGQIPAHRKAEKMFFAVTAFWYAFPITCRAASLSTGRPVSIS